MTVWTCRTCSTTFQVGLVDMCPGCTGTDVGKGAPPHALRGGVILPGYAPPVTGEGAEPETADDAVDPEEGPWPGSSSSTSPEKQQKSAAPATASRPKRARGTGSRSSKAQRGSSSARSTGTSGPGTDA